MLALVIGLCVAALAFWGLLKLGSWLDQDPVAGPPARSEKVVRKGPVKRKSPAKRKGA